MSLSSSLGSREDTSTAETKPNVFSHALNVLQALLPEGMIIPSAFDTVGHIAHLNLRDEHLPYKWLIAKVVLDKNKPRIQTVVNKIDTIQNEYKTMQLEVLAGNHSLVTTVVENGIRFARKKDQMEEVFFIVSLTLSSSSRRVGSSARNSSHDVMSDSGYFVASWHIVKLRASANRYVDLYD
ncbi:hypothetical protein JHK87_052297 [Glycine soja]|nr:hypothetical protein JHK87_052297 [Glycine soja]